MRHAASSRKPLASTALHLLSTVQHCSDHRRMSKPIVQTPVVTDTMIMLRQVSLSVRALTLISARGKGSLQLTIGCKLGCKSLVRDLCRNTEQHLAHAWIFCGLNARQKEAAASLAWRLRSACATIECIIVPCSRCVVSCSASGIKTKLLG